MNNLNPQQLARIEANRLEYGEDYASLRFVEPAQAAAALARRSELLTSLENRTTSGALGTKLDCNQLSPGCRLCVEGSWSCLFITGRCNCRCFYCPTEQEKTGEPTTNSLKFPNPPDYLDYLTRFGFKGVSFSGGEPLLAVDKTLKYISAVRRRFGDSMHIWLYTNGTLVTRDILLRLRDAGLNEIRFDIGAIVYHLDPVRLASGIIEHLTVEIPAVPEELELMRDKMTEMAEAGVRYLNLHQLRLTPHNFPHLSARNYTYLHGEKVTVLESELTALELIAHGLDKQIPLGVNYCSFVYKNRFQALAARRRLAPQVLKPTEDMTENGYLRALALTGPAEILSRQAEAFLASDLPASLWQLQGERLSFSAQLLPHLAPGVGRLHLRYFQPALLPGVTYRNAFTEVPLNKSRKVVIERAPTGPEETLEGEARSTFLRALSGGSRLDVPPKILRCEYTPEGLQDYY